MSDERHAANPGYAFAQLERALRTAVVHPVAATRERALAKADAWRAIFGGMRDGTLDVGSRTPVADTPAWVTLEVAHGGFATGRYMAEGSLRAHEEAWLASLPADAPGETPREKLNLWFLRDEGLRELVAMARSGAYRVDVPEESAWLVVAWLLHVGREVEALEVVEALRPLMHRLRFYPRPAEPRPSSQTVHVATAGEVARQLWDVRVNPHVATMNATLAVWNPLADRLVTLWLDTVEGEAPRLEAGAVWGGWPCRRWPSDWIERRDRWLADFVAAKEAHRFTGKHAHRKSNLRVLLDALERCPHDSGALGGRDVGRIRRALANATLRHGAPSSTSHASLRAEQGAIAARPLHAEVACVVAARLDTKPPESGLPTLDEVLAPVGEGESERVPAGARVPESCARRVARALDAPLDELVERGVIGSAEVLALVLPQLTASVAAVGIDDPVGRALFAQLYAAFRRRRSLLLLRLDHQVRVEELPWVAALGSLRGSGGDAKAIARETSREATLIALTGFPETLIPNRLVRELRTLSEQAQLDLPLVEEVAADIFMGVFTEKWAAAARRATDALRGTLYARYYDLPERWEREPAATRWGKRVSEPFGALCAKRAREAGDSGSFVARNGAILEQAQILTTHNLAVLVDALDLRGALRERGPDLALRGVRFALVRQAQRAPDHHNRLRAIKSSAYAWRQALFFVSILDEGAQRETLAAAEATLAELDEAVRRRLAPAVAGLRWVMSGGRFDESGRGPGGERRWLGWSAGPHWALAD